LVGVAAAEGEGVPTKGVGLTNTSNMPGDTDFQSVLAGEVAISVHADVEGMNVHRRDCVDVPCGDGSPTRNSVKSAPTVREEIERKAISATGMVGASTAAIARARHVPDQLA
jgi:hypothetical protein